MRRELRNFVESVALPPLVLLLPGPSEADCIKRGDGGSEGGKEEKEVTQPSSLLSPPLPFPLFLFPSPLFFFSLPCFRLQDDNEGREEEEEEAAPCRSGGGHGGGAQNRHAVCTLFVQCTVLCTCTQHYAAGAAAAEIRAIHRKIENRQIAYLPGLFSIEDPKERRHNFFFLFTPPLSSRREFRHPRRQRFLFSLLPPASVPFPPSLRRELKSCKTFPTSQPRGHRRGGGEKEDSLSPRPRWKPPAIAFFYLPPSVLQGPFAACVKGELL